MTDEWQSAAKVAKSANTNYQRCANALSQFAHRGLVEQKFIESPRAVGRVINVYRKKK